MAEFFFSDLSKLIYQNSRLIYDILHYSEKENIPGLLMLIDFEKAFDSVSWEFLYETLKLLGFGPKMIKWITLFNTNIIVLQSGFLSQLFPINCGCRQGDPISSYLFILGAQILQIMVSRNQTIKGIKINKKEIKLTQFADDTTLVLDGTRSSLQATLNTLEIFGTLSGLRMNTVKTQIAWIGKRKHCKEKLNVTKDLVWGKDTFSLLGIKFSVDLYLVINLNYDPILDDISKSLNVWKKRFLTPLGKITVIKSLILSKLNHLFMSIPNPDQSVINKLQSTFLKFIWDDKPDKISRKQLCSDYMRGGLCMFHLENFICSLKCTWMRRLLTQKNSPWYELCLYNLKDYEKCFYLHSLWHKTLARKITNNFWKTTLLSWAKVIDSISKDQNVKVLNSPLWYNPTISDVPLFYQDWYNKGIIFIADLFCESKLLFRRLDENFKNKN